MIYTWICQQVKDQLYRCYLYSADTYSRAQTEPTASENMKAAPLDSADCPVLSDKVRTELASRAPGQIKSDFIFPKKRTGEDVATFTSTENISMEKSRGAGSYILK